MKKIVIPVICLFMCSCALSQKVSQEVIIDDIIPTSDRITLSMVGDALIHSPIYKDANESGVYNFSKMFVDLEDVLTSELKYYNAESIIGGEALGFSGYPRFNTPKEFGESMVDMGFNIVSRANNHTLDKGEAGILYSCNFWNKYPSVLTNGSACTEDEKNHPRIMEMNGIRYTLLSYTTFTNGLTSPNDYYVSLYSDEAVQNDIAKVRGNVDIIIVAMHWGDEYKSIPNFEQRRIATYLSDLGVDIVIGTHPHVIEPIEWIGRTLVIYSLGNFISNQTTVDDYARRIGLLVNIDIIKTTTKNETKIVLDNLTTELIYTYSKDYRNYRVIPFSKIDESILKDYRTYKTKYDAIVKYYDHSIPTK